MVNKNMPLRMAGIFIFRPNFMLQIILPLLKLFMSAKLQRRLNVMSHIEDIEAFGVEKALRPMELGGALTGLPHIQALWEENGWGKTWVDIEGSDPVAVLASCASNKEGGDDDAADNDLTL